MFMNVLTPYFFTDLFKDGDEQFISVCIRLHSPSHGVMGRVHPAESVAYVTV